MRFLITLKIPRVVIQKMDTYKEKYFPAGFYKIESHVTLRPPFDLKGNRDALYEDLRVLLESHKSLSLAIRGMGTFEERVLFFRVEASDELRHLHDAIRELVDKKYKRFSLLRKERGGKEYTPHATISVASPQKIKKYKEELKDERFEIGFLVDGVSIYLWHKDQWHFDRDILFGNA